MIAREKVIKALDCRANDYELDCRDCAYYIREDTPAYCNFRQILRDALSLLKEQEAVKPVRDKETGRIWLCGNCGTYVGFEDNDPHDPNEFDKFCRECGRPILWEGR